MSNGEDSHDIFVLGLDPRNYETLKEVCEVGECRFHTLLSMQELVEADELPLRALLDKAIAQIDESGVRPDAIVGYWDFPVSSMVPLLCEHFGVPGPPLRAVLTCEHKYWSRLEQQKVTDAHPNFCLVGLNDDAPPSTVDYPMWLKPVKSFSSELAFRVGDEDEFRSSLARIRDGIGRVGEPFQFVLDKISLPEEVATAGGEACLAEEAVGGEQVTVEGYRFDSEVHVYGVVDSHMYEGTSSFERYEYPSALPQRVLDRMIDISRDVINQIELDGVPFNIEYFWDRDTDRIRLLEVNPRHSQAHAKLFDYVDGVPNHRCMIHLALNQDPDMPSGKGPYPFAATWFLRRFSDGVVRRQPSTEDITRAESVGGCAVDILANEGTRLADLPDQDSYSYALAMLHIGASSREELRSKYEQCVAALPFEFDQV